MPFRKCQAGPRKAYERPPKIGSDDQNDLRNDNHRWHPNHNSLAINGRSVASNIPAPPEATQPRD